MIGYRTLNKLTSFIKKHKDENEFKTNNVVYKILYNNCDASYVSQIKRQLKTRINEHVKTEESKHSVISKHMLKNNRSFYWQNTKILDFVQITIKELSEIIHIKTQENG